MPRQVTWYDHDIPSGTYMEWYKSDSTSVALTMGGFTKGERSGTWTWLYGNRRVKTQGSYHKGKKIGPWRNWDSKGHLMETSDLGAPE